MIDAQAEFLQRRDSDSDIQAHLPFFRQLVIDEGATKVLELGTRDGNSTVAFLAGLDATDGRLWAVDISGAPFEHPRLTFVHGDDTASETIEQVWAAGPFDIVFIDTSHEYEHTLAELDLYGVNAPIVLLHDVDVAEFGHLVAQPPYPVATAAQEWAEREGRTYEMRSGSYGLGVIR